MDNDHQAHEKREHASRVRRLLELIGLKSIVLYSDLEQNGEIIPAGIWIPDNTSLDVNSFLLNGKTLKVKKPVLHAKGERKREEQEITCPIPPDNGKYSVTFYDEKMKKSVTIGPLDYDTPTADINNALFLKGLGDIIATGNLLGGLKFTFGGRFAFKHQIKVVVDSSKLKRAGKPLALPPDVKRDIPTDNYCIVQQEGGDQFFALLKEDRTHPGTRVPAIPFFFTPNYAIKDDGIEVETKDLSSRIPIKLRQNKGAQK